MPFLREKINTFTGSFQDQFVWQSPYISDPISLLSYGIDPNTLITDPAHFIVYWSAYDSDKTSSVYRKAQFTLGYNQYYNAITYIGGDLNCDTNMFTGNADQELLVEGTFMDIDQSNIFEVQFWLSIYNNSDKLWYINSHIELYANI